VSLLVGICGGSGSGKTTLAQRIVERLCRARGPGSATAVSFDAYYHDQLHLPVEERARVNYDHPDSLDAELLVSHLQQLRSGQDVAVPVYDFATHCRSPHLRLVEAADVVVVEGILLFTFDSVADQLDYRVFRRCPEDVRFGRRRQRDLAERGRSLASIEAQLAATVKPMHDRFVEPYAHRADLITEHAQDLGGVTAAIVDHLVNLAAAVLAAGSDSSLGAGQLGLDDGQAAVPEPGVAEIAVDDGPQLLRRP
jgi:uridine kinase